MKICTKCGVEKDESEFYKRSQQENRRLYSHCKSCFYESAKNKERENPGKRLAQQREVKYGISGLRVAQMQKDQNGCCAICGDEFFDKKNCGPHVDHCHSIGKVRGLLCRFCNTGLGQFKDSPIRLQKAISYLKLFS